MSQELSVGRRRNSSVVQVESTPDYADDLYSFFNYSKENHALPARETATPAVILGYSRLAHLRICGQGRANAFDLFNPFACRDGLVARNMNHEYSNKSFDASLEYLTLAISSTDFQWL